MGSSILAELLLLRKRVSTWILLGLLTVASSFFAYIVPYVTYLNAGESAFQTQRSLTDLLPNNLVANLLAGFPFFAGVIVLILGVLTLGSEYGWGTLKTLFTQRPGRVQVFLAKLAALGIALIPLVLVPFAIGALFSYIIAIREDAAIAWPGAWLLVRALGAAWFLLAVWATFGVVLAVLSQGTALAIGIGILYGLVIEGLISAFADQVSLLSPLTQGFLRANGYSLVRPFGVASEVIASSGPASFAGPFVDSAQAFLVLAAYLGAFALLAAVLLRRRDVV